MTGVQTCALPIFGAATQDEHGRKDSSEHTGDHPEDDAEDAVAREDECQCHTDGNAAEEAEQHRPDDIRVIAASHLEDLSHLLETTRLLRLLRGFFLTCHGVKDTGIRRFRSAQFAIIRFVHTVIADGATPIPLREAG